MSDGSIAKYKVRLVAKGFLQKQNVDYFDMFALVTIISSIRILIALASIHELFIYKMDVKTTFLNGDLEEGIYMLQLEGCIAPGQENKVCKLNKSLYGLKQAPKLSCPYPCLGEERGCDTGLGLLNLLFRHLWTHFIYNFIVKYNL